MSEIEDRESPEDESQEDEFAEEIINKYFQKQNAKAAAEDLITGAHDPQMAGVAEVEMSEGVPTEKRGKVRRPVMAVGIWAKLATLKPKEALVLSSGKTVSFLKSGEYQMYLLTNRMVKIKDPVTQGHVYCPCENIIYFTVEADAATQRRLTKESNASST